MTLNIGAATAARAKVRIQGLGMTFRGLDGSSKEVLRGVDLSVGANEFVSVVGPSGTGKTTLLRCIAGLERPTSGAVLIDGKAIDGPPPKLALVFQEYGRSLFPWLRVVSNVMLPLRNSSVLDKVARRARAEAALSAVGLGDALELYPWQLSGGMQQRVAIARALASEPEVLLMDEPFASVDADTRSTLEDLVLRLKREYAMTVILVTHDVDEAVYMANRVAVVRGKPASIQEALAIDLPSLRDQVTTKALPEFIKLRTHVLRSFLKERTPGTDASKASLEGRQLSVVGD